MKSLFFTMFIVWLFANAVIAAAGSLLSISSSATHDCIVRKYHMLIPGDAIACHVAAASSDSVQRFAKSVERWLNEPL